MNAHTSILKEFGFEGADLATSKATAAEDIELLLARARGTARADGYAQGAADASAEFDRDILIRLDAIKDAMAAALEDRARAKRELSQACREILMTFLTAVAPHLASENLTPELVAAVEDAIADSPEPKIIVEVCSGQFDDLARRLEEEGLACTLRASESLSLSQARILWQDGFDQIDVQPAIDRAVSILGHRLTQSMAIQSNEEGEQP